MPNWVKNVLSVENCNEKRFDQICRFVKSEKSLFDFNKIIPMPEDLHLEEGSANNFFKDLYRKYPGDAIIEGLLGLECGIHEDELKAARRYIDGRNAPCGTSDLDILKESMRRGKQYIENQKRYGAETWYFWCSAHWGTKWNNLDDVIIPDGEMQWEFNTAWTPPLPVIRVLSQMFPEVRFVLQYADEDLGQNCGLVEYLDGVCTVFPPIDPLEFACHLWDVDPDEVRGGSEDEYTN